MSKSRPFSLSLIAAALLAATAAVQAQPIELVPNTLNAFRDTRGANDVGITQGDRFQMGANIVGGSLGTSLGILYEPEGFNINPLACVPLTVSPNFCSRTTRFDASRLEPWTLRFTRGADTLDVMTPSLAGTENPVPFPVSVALTGAGLTPTVSWEIPGSFTPDGFRVQIFDKGRRLADGSADIIHAATVNAVSGSYALPSVLSSGLALQQGGNYSINFQVIETRDDRPFAGNNSQILRRSNSFFAFTPLSGNVPDDIALPTVVDGVYNFNVTNVGPDSITFIDPFVAVGYDYATGAGDPKFASVVLPDIGDGQFTLEYTDAAGAQSVSLADGTQFFFGAGGVSAFRVTGIETSAMLDPTDATAFITGLTFVTKGGFTGTMTPITQFVAEVPEPSTYGLMALGLFGLGVAARRRRAH